MANYATVKLGSRGKAVAELQRLLKLTDDGIFGKGTLKAVKAFQKKNSILDDGIVGKRTWQLLRGEERNPTDLRKQDIDRVATYLGVDRASVMAVSEVESKGSGFLKGKPKILFERHIFHRQLVKMGYDLLADMATKSYPGVCNPETGGYQGGVREWDRMDRARRMNKDAAEASASYGRYQIMGFNYKACGFMNLDGFILAMSKSEGEQLKAFASFIKSNPKLHTALREQDWATFAKIYNGPSYAKNKYDVKLAEAYKRLKTR